VGIRCTNHVTPLYPQKLLLTSPTGGGRSVGMVRSRTKTTEFSLVLVIVRVLERKKSLIPLECTPLSTLKYVVLLLQF
jgi:hypothetical protein